MDFIENNKKVIVPVVAGIVIALVMDWLDIPEWLIGAVVALVVVLGSGRMVEAYDRHVAPKLTKRGGN